MTLRRICAMIIVVMSLCTANAQSRWLIGSGLTYCSYIERPGINFSVAYEVLKDLHVGPDFSAILTRKEMPGARWLKRKELEGNINVTYLRRLSRRLDYYPITGLNVSKVSVHEENQRAEKRIVAGLNLGIGLEHERKNHRYFIEVKYVSQLKKWDATAGLLFPL